MADNGPETHERFFKNIEAMTSVFRELLVKCKGKGSTVVEPVFIDLAETYLNGFDKQVMISNFIEYSYDCWGQILDHDEDFFNENCGMVFKDIPGNHVDTVKALVHATDSDGEYIIDDDDRGMIWAYFESFVKICIKHIHKSREPVYIKKNGIDKPIYRKPAYPKVKRLQHFASRCKIDLWD